MPPASGRRRRCCPGAADPGSRCVRAPSTDRATAKRCRDCAADKSGLARRWRAEHPEAVEALKIALWSEETVAAHVSLAEAFLQVQDQAAARIEVDRALAIDPKSEDALALKARIGG